MFKNKTTERRIEDVSEYNEAKNSRFSEKKSTQSHHVKKKKAHNTESVKMMT